MQNLVYVAHPSWAKWTPWGFTDCIDHDQGLTYTRAAGISYTFQDGTTATLEFTAETDHSSSSQQCIEADSTNGIAKETRWDFWKQWTNEHHYYWGSNLKFVLAAPGALLHVFYTY